MMKTLTQGYMSTFKEVIMNQAVLNFLSGKGHASTTRQTKSASAGRTVNNLFEAEMNKEYLIKDVVSGDKEIVSFLFTLGCFKGQAVTVISVLSETYVLAIKDARYSIDADLAKAVILEQQ